MKTRVFKIASVAIVVATMSLFSVSAQSGPEFFFDKKYEGSKMVSQVKYELGYSGLYEKTTRDTYSFNESGDLVKQEKLSWNNRADRWEPLYCITKTYNDLDNTVIAEYAIWNKKENKYNSPCEKATYQMNESGKAISWSISKGIGKSFESTIAYGRSSSIGTESTTMVGFGAKSE